VNNWLKHDDSRRIPPVTPTPEESQEFANIMNEVNTFTNEMFIKFVMGQGELTGFDQYVDQVKSMGIERAIAIQQSALDRYNAR
jgi:putative aldouronate transport system substrate-binding protein